MRFLIAGGTGLIGKAFIDHLSDEHEIIVLTRDPRKAVKRFSRDHLRFIQWDGKTMSDEVIKEIVDNVVIMNFSGESVGKKRWTKKRKQALIDSRLQSTRTLVEAVKASNANIHVFVQASAIGYYGDKGEEIITESSTPGNEFLAELTVQWENELEALPRHVRHVITRFGIVLAKEDGALPQMVLPVKLCIGGPFGSGKQWMSWISIHDVVNALDFLIQTPEARGAFNFVSPNPMRNKDLMKGLGRFFHRPVFLPMPRLPIRVLIGEFANNLFISQRVIPQKLLDLGYSFLHTDLQEALKAIYS